MKTLLLNNSLLNSASWALTAPNSKHRDQPTKTWSQVAYEDLEGLLNRKKFEPNEACTRGLKFEDQLYRFARMQAESLEGFSPEFIGMVEAIRGYQFQKYMEKFINFTFDGEKYRLKLYGIFDCFKEGHIQDIKTTAKYKTGKYLAGLQHVIYCYISGCLRFDYLIAEWGEYPKIKKVHRETFETCKQEIEESELFLIGKMQEFLKFLKNVNMLDTYINVYCAKENK